MSSYDFNGEISVVIIDNNQLDTSCPYDQGRVLNGSHLTTLCTPFSNPCNKEYSSCVSYTADNEVCQCSTGFPADSCNEETGNCMIFVLLCVWLLKSNVRNGASFAYCWFLLVNVFTTI